MSEQVIEIMEYISNKLGIVIDWTAENVYPYAVDLVNRFAMVNIVNHSIHLVIALMIFLLSIWVVKNCVSKTGRFYSEDLDEYNLLVAIIPGMFAVISFFVTLGEIETVINWIILPEMQIFNEIKMAGII